MNQGILIFNDLIAGVGYLLVKLILIMIVAVLLYFFTEDME